MGEISVRLLGGFRRAGGFYRWNKESPTRVLLYEYFYPSTPLLHIFEYIIMFFKYHILCLMARNIFYHSNLNLATLATSEVSYPFQRYNSSYNYR